MDAFAKYVGIPFKEGGRNRDGIDCYGLVRLILFEVFSVATLDYSDYRIDNRADCAHLINKGAANGEWEAVQHPARGDVVVLNIHGQPMHCGMVLGSGLFIHASHETGVVVERLNAPCWTRRISKFFRHRGMPNG